MYLARRERKQGTGGLALTGPVTLPGDPAGAYLEGERRGVAVYAPGGYHWVPGTGDEVLVLKAGSDGEKPCAVGLPANGEGLQPGEVLITGGDCSIFLDRKGNVAVTGTFTVNGTVVGPAPKKDDEEDA
jgi:hypothetical protein